MNSVGDAASEGNAVGSGRGSSAGQGRRREVAARCCVLDIAVGAKKYYKEYREARK